MNSIELEAIQLKLAAAAWPLKAPTQLDASLRDGMRDEQTFDDAGFVIAGPPAIEASVLDSRAERWVRPGGR